MENVPVACTLDGGAARERIARWRSLDERYLVEREHQPGRVRAHYRDEVGVRDELDALAAAERSCCGFLTWTVLDEGPVLLVEGPDDALAALTA